VYGMCMARTNVDLDEHACATVMRRYDLPSKRAAVNFALRQLAAELSGEEARALKGSGWEGDLAELRESRFSPT
jgi:Arc/MetJ family transcription regulator